MLVVALGTTCLSSHATHSWNDFHWKKASGVPLTLSLGKNVTDGWAPFYQKVANYWTVPDAVTNNPPILSINLVDGGTDPRRCKPTLGRIEVCNDRYGRNGWLGVAQVWLDGSHITQATAKLNDTYFGMTKYNSPAWKNLVMCQEIGHTLGLDHVNETYDLPDQGTCMDYTNSPDNNQFPNSHDYDMLRTIYGAQHSDATSGQTTTKHLPAAAQEPDRDDPSQWGQLVRSTNGGRTERFELDFGGRQKLVTFVIWAEERGNGPR